MNHQRTSHVISFMTSNDNFQTAAPSSMNDVILINYMKIQQNFLTIGIGILAVQGTSNGGPRKIVIQGQGKDNAVQR